MIAADISFWTFLWYAFAGLVIGVLARLFMPGRPGHEHLRDDGPRGRLRDPGRHPVERDLQGSARHRMDRRIVVAVILLWLYSRFAPKTGGGTTA